MQSKETHGERERTIVLFFTSLGKRCYGGGQTALNLPFRCLDGQFYINLDDEVCVTVTKFSSKSEFDRCLPQSPKSEKFRG